MNKTRKNHFLPEFYLKGFLNESQKLFSCRKVRGSWQYYGEKDPGEIFFKKKMHPQLHEDFLSTRESIWNKIFEKLRKKDLFSIKEDEYYKIGEFAAWQFLRLPNSMKIAKDFNDEQVQKSLSKIDAEVRLSEKQKLFTKDLFPKIINSPEVQLHFRSNSVKEFSKMIFYRGWVFLVAPNDINFLTSDSPFYAGGAVGNQHFIPLTKTVMLLIGNKPLEKLEIIPYFPACEKMVNNLNFHIAKLASEYIAGPNRIQVEKNANEINKIFQEDK